MWRGNISVSIFLSSLLFASLRCASTIQTVDNFDALMAAAANADENTLVLLDFAKVMCTHKDPWMIGHKEARHAADSIKSFSKGKSPIAQALSPEKHKQLLATFYQSRQYKLVDKKLPHIIEKLQEKKAKVIALTSFKAGNDQATKNQRHGILRAHGIDFGGAFPRYKKLTLSQLSLDGKSPIFYKGVLSNRGIFPKGDVLRAFFDAISWRPKRVIFYDDRLDNVQSVQQAVQSLCIDFEGYVYTGVKQLPAFFDPAVAAYQVKHLVEHGCWVSGKKAKKILGC